MTMPRRDRFINGSLVKIRDHLNAASGEGQAAARTGEEPVASGQVPGQAIPDREFREALAKRADEFRALRRDVAARLAEKIAAIPEELRIEEERMGELREALAKFASLLESLEAIDDSGWLKECDYGPALGRAMRQVENVRLEQLRIAAKLAALQRESAAADNPGAANASLLPELNSLSWRQGFRLGLCLGLPVIIGVVVAALVVALTFIMLWW